MPEQRVDKFVIISNRNKCSSISKYLLYSNFSADGTATTSFLETPLMSSYLVAFVVSDLAYLSNTNDTNVFRHRVYSRLSEIESTRLALNNSELILQAFEEYLQIPFSLPKMDLIAVPEHMSGAMENWGLLFALLYFSSN